MSRPSPRLRLPGPGRPDPDPTNRPTKDTTLTSTPVNRVTNLDGDLISRKLIPYRLQDPNTLSSRLLMNDYAVFDDEPISRRLSTFRKVVPSLDVVPYVPKPKAHRLTCWRDDLSSRLSFPIVGTQEPPGNLPVVNHTKNGMKVSSVRPINPKAPILAIPSDQRLGGTFHLNSTNHEKTISGLTNKRRHFGGCKRTTNSFWIMEINHGKIRTRKLLPCSMKLVTSPSLY